MMMHKTSDFDINRYGHAPNDWRPFPQLDDYWTIRNLIDAHDRDKRAWAQQNNQDAKWILVSYSNEMLSADAEVRDKAREAIQEGPCLIIIDPVSLMHKKIYNDIIVNGGLQSHREAFVIGIAPFVSQMHTELYDTTIDIENQLRQRLAAVYARFTKYFDPSERACVLSGV
jgi:hypothetical protein